MDWLPTEYIVTCRTITGEYENVRTINVLALDPHQAVARAAHEFDYPDDSAYSVGRNIGPAYVSMRESFMCSKREL